MRFTRRPKYAFKWTTRMEQAYRRKLAKNEKNIRDSHPLIHDQFERPRPLTVEEERQRREKMCNETERSWRKYDADNWREARALYFQCDDMTRKQIREDMKNHRSWTVNASTLINIVEGYNGDRARRDEFYRQKNEEIRREIQEKERNTPVTCCLFCGK